MPAETVKQKILQVAEGFPDWATLKDATEWFCFLAKVEEGLCQSDAGETVSTPRPFVRSLDDSTDPFMKRSISLQFLTSPPS